MATFSASVRKSKKRADGTWKVYIRFTHNRVTKDIPTSIFVGKKDMTVSFKIKNNVIIDKCDDLIRLFKKRMYDLNLEVNDMPIDTIVDYLTRKEDNHGLSFTEWANNWIEKKAKQSKHAADNYKTALKVYTKFLGRSELLMNDVNTPSLTKFIETLSDKPRAASLYPNCIAKMFNDARDFYNDEDNDIVCIKHTLRKLKIPKQNVAEKRALTVEQIRAIFSCPYDTKKKYGFISQHDLALDCFKLSFALMGINSVDLHSCSVIENGVIKYERSKTKGRRSDRAYMEVKIPQAVKHIYEKWRDKKGEKVFSFHKRFTEASTFSKSLNRGLKKVGAELDIPNLQFYAARHSMASIAVNEVGINLWTVNLMLCHTAPSMKVTELYIKKDFSQENEAMQKVLDYVLEK